MLTSPELIASLNNDLALEHGAIVQYVIHGAMLRDVGITDPVRRTAREEMWHFEWLTEAIVERGGEPALERADVFLPKTMAASMSQDVATEDRALGHYAQTMNLIGDADPELARLIERIMDDERSHRATFERLAAEVQAAGEEAYVARPITGREDLAVIGATIGVEYMTVLQYLWNKYGCGDCKEGDLFFEFAVDEMRHLIWAATYLPGLADPVPPDVPTDRVHFVRSVGEARDVATRVEAMAAAFYPAKVDQAKSEALRDDLARALGQHEYHRGRLEAAH